jgi:hypothetical protein
MASAGSVIPTQCDDEALILKYLLGFETTDKKHRPVKRYFKPGSPEERKAREVLTRRFRSIDACSGLDPLSINIRQALASVLTPDEFCTSERTIEFKRAKRRGRPMGLESKLAIGEFIWNQTALRGDCICGKNHKKFESVVKEAEDKYGLSRRAVLNAWKIYRELLEAAK